MFATPIQRALCGIPLHAHTALHHTLMHAMPPGEHRLPARDAACAITAAAAHGGWRGYQLRRCCVGTGVMPRMTLPWNAVRAWRGCGIFANARARVRIDLCRAYDESGLDSIPVCVWHGAISSCCRHKNSAFALIPRRHSGESRCILSHRCRWLTNKWHAQNRSSVFWFAAT